MKIDNCFAEVDGGAIYLRDPINMEIKGSEISNCKAGTKGTQFNEIGEGGGIFYECNIAEDATVN